MKTLFIVPKFHMNLFFAVKYLLEDGHEVGIFVNNRHTPEREDIRFRALPPGTPEQDIDLEIRSFAPDIVFLRKAAPLSTFAARTIRNAGLRMVHYDQNPVSGYLRSYEIVKWWARGLSAERVSPVFGTGKWPTDWLASYLPWPVGTLAPPPERMPRTGPLQLLCVGKLQQQQKNQFRLIDALKDEVRAGKVELTLAGLDTSIVKGASREHYEKILGAAAASGGSIRIVENVPFTEMPRLYSTHDICVLPSSREPLGTSPLESMAYGCIPIISNECGSAGTITDGHDGYIFPVTEFSVLRKRIIEIHEDAHRQAAMSKAARNTAETQLGRKQFLMRINNVMEGRLAANRTRTAEPALRP